MFLECISDQQLQDLVEECLSQQEHTQVLEHAARCVACQDLLADLYSSRSMDGAAAELAQTRPQEAPPHMVDEFRVLQRLGRGGMGVVYLAEDTLLRRPVAIKFLHEELPNLEGRSLDEARAIARLNHPNVLAIYSIGNHRGRPYLVSEYVKGRSLASIARPRPLPEALEIIRALGRGLAAAHEQGVLHRDIKPANVIITGPGEVKLIDFGLASLMGEAITASGRSTDQARPIEVAGTPLYMAPELWRGQPATVSSDLYALGAVLFELCTGHPPHRGSNTDKLAEQVLHHDAPLLRRIVGDDEFGRPSQFRDRLADRGERYLLEVPYNTSVRRPSHWPGRAQKWKSVRHRRDRHLLPIRLIDSDGRRLDDEHQTDGSEGHRRLMAIRKKDRRGTECGWASSRRKPEIGGR